jgi:hypothetical protein
MHGKIHDDYDAYCNCKGTAEKLQNLYPAVFKYVGVYPTLVVCNTSPARARPIADMLAVRLLRF